MLVTSCRSFRFVLFRLVSSIVYLKMQQPLLVLVVGASGDLAQKKTYPALYNLWQGGFLPKTTVIWGFARTAMSTPLFREKQIRPGLVVSPPTSPSPRDTQQGTHQSQTMPKSSISKSILITTPPQSPIGYQNTPDDFLNLCFYRNGKDYGDAAGLGQILQTAYASDGTRKANILVYLAIPPSVFGVSMQALKDALHSLERRRIQGDLSRMGYFVRVVLEKPFGSDTDTCKTLLNTIHQQQGWMESELYRIDHYLGKEMVQNIPIIRYNNEWLKRLWNREVIQSVHILFKEPFGTDGRGGYFDEVGIIRDVCQNHLLQVLTLIAMKLPDTLSSNAIRDAKVAVLQNMPPLIPEDCLLGQYNGYKNDRTIRNPQTSTPTYACLRAWVNTPLWQGVPFILEAGKALDEHLCEARLHFRDQTALVLRIQPRPAIFLTAHIKAPGFSSRPVRTRLGLEYDTNLMKTIPDAYPRLLLDVLRGRQIPFVRGDELLAAWELFTPLLEATTGVVPLPYKQGTHGPTQRTEFLQMTGINVTPWALPRASL